MVAFYVRKFLIISLAFPNFDNRVFDNPVHFDQVGVPCYPLSVYYNPFGAAVSHKEDKGNK